MELLFFGEAWDGKRAGNGKLKRHCHFSTKRKMAGREEPFRPVLQQTF
jgi:hypothetical protein